MLWKTVSAALFMVLTGCDRGPSPSDVHAHSHGQIAALDADAAVAADAGRTVYACPMHPEVVSDKPGDCPKCNMHLEPKPAGEK